MRIQIDAADKVFSKYIRLRDGCCVRCYSPVRYNDNGDPISHQASHFWGRRKESVRFDPQNVDTLCTGCHQSWGGDKRKEYEEFKIGQMGQREFDKLKLIAHTPGKKDRKMQKIIWGKMYKELKDSKTD